MMSTWIDSPRESLLPGGMVPLLYANISAVVLVPQAAVKFGPASSGPWAEPRSVRR